MSKISQERYFRSEKEVPMGFQCRHQSKTPLKTSVIAKLVKIPTMLRLPLLIKLCNIKTNSTRMGEWGKAVVIVYFFFFSVDHKVFAH